MESIEDQFYTYSYGIEARQNPMIRRGKLYHAGRIYQGYKDNRHQF